MLYHCFIIIFVIHRFYLRDITCFLETPELCVLFENHISGACESLTFFLVKARDRTPKKVIVGRPT